MRVQVGRLWIFALVTLSLGGCGSDEGAAGAGGVDGAGARGGAGGAGGAAGTAGTDGTGGMGGRIALPCSPDSLCETDGLLCNLAEGSCVECLSKANCAGEMQACIDGSCRERLCLEDSECPPERPQCTDTGCAPCVGEVAPDDQRGACFDARGPNGESPTRDSDGCSAQQFIAALEDAGYDIPDDPEVRQGIADNPLERVSEGLCTVPFGNENANANTAGPDLRSACELHDYCYAVCGSTRAQCDDEFRSRLLDTCAATYAVGPCRITCDVLALIYAKAVADQPETGWVGGQGRNCQCCPDFTTDGTCDEMAGESVANSRDCKGDLPNGASCVLNTDCESENCGVHGECTPPSCLANGDCSSGICNWGVCLARPLEEGSGCSTSNACTSGVCTLGVCRECGRDDQCAANKHCNLLGDCIDDLGNNAVCTANAECLSNICSAGFCAECVRDDQCAANKHCNLFGDCINDLSNNAVCTANAECLSNICSAGFCAECVRDSQCAANKHCNLFGDCINDLGPGNPCTANAECISGTCIGVCL